MLSYLLSQLVLRQVTPFETRSHAYAHFLPVVDVSTAFDVFTKCRAVLCIRESVAVVLTRPARLLQCVRLGTAATWGKLAFSGLDAFIDGVRS